MDHFSCFVTAAVRIPDNADRLRDGPTLAVKSFGERVELAS